MNDIASQPKQSLVGRAANALSGVLRAPGDRATAQAGLVLAAITVGRSTLLGVTPTPELLASAEALRQLGVGVRLEGDAIHIDGLGPGGLLEPQAPLVPASPDATALLLGLLAPYEFVSRLKGPAAMAPAALRAGLAPIGQIEDEQDDEAGLSLRASPLPLPLQHVAVDAASKPALLLAAAQVAGISTLCEPAPGPDAMEKLLAAFGAGLSLVETETGARLITLTGLGELRPQTIALSGDPALSAYLAVAGLIVPGSDITIENVLINPSRTGLIDTLLEMGGDIMFVNQRQSGGEHVADLRVRSSRMKGIALSAEHATSLAEDMALLAVAAAFAEGESRFNGAGDAALAEALAAQKIAASREGDALVIAGTGKVEGGGRPVAGADPRLAMSLLILGLASRRKVALEDVGVIETLFPGFADTLIAAGARIEAPKKGRP